VGEGTVDVGITGRDLLLDSASTATEHLRLGFARSTFRFAAPAGQLTDIAQIAGHRVATSYPVLVADYLREHGVEASGIVRLDGAVETAIRLGVADVIADVVSTGATLRQAGLVPVGEPILISSALLVRRTGAPADGQVDQLVRRLQGVLVARRYVMLAYDVRTDLLDRATALTPGIESPTISPLHREGWVAVQAMVRRVDVHRVMDELYDLGARAILVTDIHACRL
jgi:ATP phosphoribosyltransferase